MDQLPRLGKRELICLPLFTCNYVVSVWRGFLFLWVLGMGYVIKLWHSLSLPYNYFEKNCELSIFSSARTLAFIPDRLNKAFFVLPMNTLKSAKSFSSHIVGFVDVNVFL